MYLRSPEKQRFQPRDCRELYAQNPSPSKGWPPFFTLSGMVNNETLKRNLQKHPFVLKVLVITHCFCKKKRGKKNQLQKGDMKSVFFEGSMIDFWEADSGR